MFICLPIWNTSISISQRSFRVLFSTDWLYEFEQLFWFLRSSYAFFVIAITSATATRTNAVMVVIIIKGYFIRTLRSYWYGKSPVDLGFRITTYVYEIRSLSAIEGGKLHMWCNVKKLRKNTWTCRTNWRSFRFWEKLLGNLRVYNQKNPRQLCANRKIWSHLGYLCIFRYRFVCKRFSVSHWSYHLLAWRLQP